MSNTISTDFNDAKTSLEELGYVMIQYTGGVSPLTESQLEELSEIGVRVQGFDNLFTTETFSTISFVKDKEGLLKFLKLGICQRYVADVIESKSTQRDGVIFASNPLVTIKLNMEHPRTVKFKSAFIGRGGKEIKQLSKALRCSITLKE